MGQYFLLAVYSLLRVAPRKLVRYDILPIVPSSTTSVTSMSLLTTKSCPQCPLLQPLSPPCLSSPHCPVHSVLLYNLCHLHVSPHHIVLSTVSSSTTSVTSMSLLTTMSCPQCPLLQPLSLPCLSSPQCPVHSVLFYNLCHFHVSPHHIVLSTVSSSTTSVTSMSLLTTMSCPQCPLLQPLSLPCLSSPQCPVHSVLFYNLCHFHVSPHHNVLSTVSSSTTSVTSMSLLTTLSCPQCPLLQPLSPPCLSSPQSPIHSVLFYNLCHLHVSPHHKVLSTVSSSTTSVTSMSLLTTLSCPQCPLLQPLSPPCLSSPQSPIHSVLFYNLCHLHVSPHHKVLSTVSSSTTSVTSMSLLTTKSYPQCPLLQPLSPPCLSSPQSPIHSVLFYNLCHFHVSPHHNVLSTVSSSTTSVTSMSLLTTLSCPQCPLLQPLSLPCLSSPQCPVHSVLLYNLCHLHVSPHHIVLSTVSSSTTSVTSMSLLTTLSCPQCPLLQPLSLPCLSSPQCPVHSVLFYNLCHFHVSPHHNVLSTVSSSTTSVTSMSLLTTMSCPQCPLLQPLSPPCLSSPHCPVHSVLFYNLCHLHVSPHHKVLSTVSSSTTSVTSMSLLTTKSYPQCPLLQPLSPPYLSSPHCPVHSVLFYNLCHFHVSPHHNVLSTVSSSTTSVTSMSLLTTKSYPQCPPLQPLSLPCLSSPHCPVHSVLFCNLCHFHVSPHHNVLSTVSSSTTSVTSMSLLTTKSYPQCPLLQPLSPPCLSSPQSPIHSVLFYNLCHLHVSPHHKVLSTVSSSTTSVTSMSLLTTKSYPQCPLLQPLSLPCLSSPQCPVHSVLLYNLCHLHVSLHHIVLSTVSSSTTSVTSMSLLTTMSCPQCPPLQPLSPPCLSSPHCPVHSVLFYNLCHLHVSPHHIVLSTVSSSTTSVTSMSLLTTLSCPQCPPLQPLSPPCLSSPHCPVHSVLFYNLCHFHVSPHHIVLSTVSSSTTSVTSMSLLTTKSCPQCPLLQPLSPPCLSSPQSPIHSVLFYNLCHLHVSPHHKVLSTVSSSTTSVTSMSLLTTKSYPQCPLLQPLSLPCLSSPQCPVHSVLLYNLCHLHVSPHHIVLSTVSSSTTSVTSMSLLTTMSCPQCPLLQPLSPPCLSSPQCPVHSVLLYNLCHLHVSPHHKVLSTVSSSTTSVTSMSLLTTKSYPQCPLLQPLSLPCLSSPQSPIHSVLLYNLCHFHVSPHHNVLSTVSSSTTSVTSMSLLTTKSYPQCPLLQPLSPPCLSSPHCPVHSVLLYNLCHLHVSPHHIVLSTVSSSTTSVTSMSLLTTKSCPQCPPLQPLSPPCLSSPHCPVHSVLFYNLCHFHVSPHHKVLSTVSSSTTSVTSMSLLTTMSCPQCPLLQPLSPPCLSSPQSPIHSVLFYNLCHLHVSPHHNVLSTVSSSTTSVTSMSLLTTMSYPQGPPLQPLSPPCLSSPQSPIHSVLLYNLCHLHVSPHHNVLSTVSSSTTSVTSMSLLTTKSYPQCPLLQPLSPPCLSSPHCPVHSVLFYNLCHFHVSPHHKVLSTVSSSTTSVTSMSLLTTLSCPQCPLLQPLSPPCHSSPQSSPPRSSRVLDRPLCCVSCTGIQPVL